MIKKTLLIITICAFLLRIVNYQYPPLLWDEASIGYNAYSLLQTGRDEYGKIFPLIFKSFGDYKPGVYIYLTIPFIAIFGLTELSVRLPSIILGSLLPILLYLLITTLNPKSKKRLYACYGSGNLLGYMIIADIEVRNVDLKYCIDVWFKKEHEYIIGSIIDFILKQKETPHYGAIILPHFNMLISNYLSSIGLFKVKSRKIKNYYSAPESIKEKLCPDNCYLVHIQGDRGISSAI